MGLLLGRPKTSGLDWPKMSGTNGLRMGEPSKPRAGGFGGPRIKPFFLF